MLGTFKSFRNIVVLGEEILVKENDVKRSRKEDKHVKLSQLADEKMVQLSSYVSSSLPGSSTPYVSSTLPGSSPIQQQKAKASKSLTFDTEQMEDVELPTYSSPEFMISSVLRNSLGIGSFQKELECGSCILLHNENEQLKLERDKGTNMSFNRPINPIFDTCIKVTKVIELF